MSPDEFKDIWDTQSSRIRSTVDKELLDAETRRFQKRFTSNIFWRDVREIGIALLLIPLWLFLGLKNRLPWTWYLAVPALAWIAGYMLVDRRRNQPRSSGSDETLCQRLESTLAQVDHQIRLVKSVLWWYLLPLGLPMLAFFCQSTWMTGSMDWLTAMVVSFELLFLGGILSGVYYLNQNCVRTQLMPRREELRSQLQRLQEESPDDEEFVQE